MQGYQQHPHAQHQIVGLIQMSSGSGASKTRVPILMKRAVQKIHCSPGQCKKSVSCLTTPQLYNPGQPLRHRLEQL
jgi:hypothetical protein